jgi:Zn-dependent metalloprotease
MKTNIFFLSVLFLISTVQLTDVFAQESADPFQRYGYSFYFNQNQKALTTTLTEGLDAANFIERAGPLFPLGPNDTYQEQTTFEDKLGMTHSLFKQLYRGIPVQGGGLAIHTGRDETFKVNGRFYPGINTAGVPQLSEETAVKLAYDFINGPNPYHEKVTLIIAPLKGDDKPENFRLCYQIEVLTGDALQQGIVQIDASSGELVNILATTCLGDEEGTAHTVYNGVQTITTDNFAGGYRLMETGRPIHTRNMQHTTNLNFAIDFVDSDNIWDKKNRVLRSLTLNSIAVPWWQDGGQTKPNIYLEFRDASNTLVAQTRPILDSFPPYTFPIQLPLLNPPYMVAFRDEDGSPAANDFGGQFTIAASGNGNFNFSSFGNSGNYQIVEENNPALDAHWCLEETYDFFQQQFGRNSFDNAGGQIRSYVHFAFGWPNAAWGTLDNRMFLGDGDGVSTSYRTYINVVAHEFTHGVIYHNGGGGLIYQGESGALNESFADIFGAAAEHYIKPASADWLHGEEGSLIPGGFVRSMNDPHSKGHPDTYGVEDPYWINPQDTLDAGGIHINSGVQNHWFYLLVEGGSGVNAKGDGYQVTGIGWEKALDIVYRNLTTYMIASTMPVYLDAWSGSLMAAEDLFGAGSAEYLAVSQAWYAVGIGNDPGPDPWCSGLTILTDPMGQISDGSENNDYTNNTDCSWLIQPLTANSITLNFSEFKLGDVKDSLWIYDGANDQASVLFAATGETLPGAVTSSDGVMYLRFVSDSAITGKGWTAEYTANHSIFCEENTLLTSPDGTFHDGSLENPYGNHTECSWLIQPENAKEITLEFLEMDTELDQDPIRIYDGPDSNAPLLATVSGNNLPSPIKALSGSMYVHFSTNNLVRKSGWTATYGSTISNTENTNPTNWEWSCYPNPGQGIYYLKSSVEDVHGLSIKVYDILGNNVYTIPATEIAAKAITIDISHLPNGIYHLNIAGHQDNKMIKLTKM